MTALELLSNLSSKDIEIWADGDRLRYNAPKGALTPDLRKKLVVHKSEILALLRQAEAVTSSASVALKPVSRAGDLPLSFAQQRLWFLNLLEPGSIAYNIPAALRLFGPINVKAFELSLNEILRRHEVLRTTFTTADDQPVQVISSSLTLTAPVVDLQDLLATEQESEVQRLATEEAQRPFDLSQGPLLRATLLKLNEEDHVLLLTMHHIVSDGWSMGVLFRELSILYEAFSAGKPSPLAELAIQYADFAVWQRQWLQGDVLETQLAYWRQQLDGAAPALELPTDRPRPAIQTHRGAIQSLALSKELTTALQALARREGVTLFMTLLAAFKIMLYRLTGQKDIIVGTPIANRNRTEIEGLIGFFVNSLVMRTDLSGQPTFRELLERVRKTALGAYVHQDMPFDRLVEELAPERDLSRNPLFQVFFNHIVPMGDNVAELLGLEAEAVDRLDRDSKFDMSLTVLEGEGGLAASFEYNTDLFDADRIERMMGHFQTLLEGIVADPEKCICDLPILDEAERRQLLVEWNDTVVEYPRDKCINELFEKQVERTPDAIAVILGETAVSYKELNQRSNHLAHHLRTIGIAPEVLVGIYIERSIEMVVGLLSIMKAGGAYVPLDPGHPKDRLAFMLEDSGVSVLLTHKRLLDALPEHSAKVICFDSDWKLIAKESHKNFDSGTSAGNLAYVIYTSGSTGKPKGVLGLHRGAINRFHWMWLNYPFADDEVCCQKTALGFVDSVWEIFGPLLQGKSIVIIPDEVLKDTKRFILMLAKYQVSRIVLVPSLLRVMLNLVPDLHQQLPSLKFWVTSGESLPVELAHQFAEAMPDSTLVNLYGSSEVSADSTYHQIRTGRSLNSVPIGRPIANTQIYLLDKFLQPVPIGVPGELYISGDGLARGYLNRPELTEKAFISHPFSSRPTSRLYKTGDSGRWVTDGNIEFLGRIDLQVKIRGFRIELGEVETVLSQHPDVSEATVTARENLPDEKRLVAYFVTSRKQTLTIDALRRYLKQKLPDYMVPSAFILLDALPLMPNGKVDRRALPAPDKVWQKSAESSDKPCDELELQLTKIWEKVLGIKTVGTKDNFFDLGGHSLLAVRLFAQIHKIFGKDLPLTTLFQAPTVEQLAGVLRQKGWSSPWSSLVPMQPSGSRPPFFCTHGCGGIVFHMQGLVRHLFPEQPFYGLKAQGLEKGEAPHTRIEDMAAFYIKEIQTIQPDGPYFIGSSGRGSAIVLEMVEQLKSQGQNVALLVLINPSTLHPELTHFSFIRSIYGGSLKFFFHRLVDFMHNRPLLPYIKYTFFNRVLVNWRRFQKFVPMNIQREQRFRDVIRDALLNYTPHHVYPGRITCFLYEKSPINPQDRVRDWYDVAGGGLDIRIVPGTFESMWREPHVQILAEQLKTCLEKAQTDSEGFIDTKN